MIPPGRLRLAPALRPLLAATALVSAAAVLTAGAQNPPRRPRLSRDADTNDARSYYRWGLERLRSRPQDAAAALYWAERLDPGSPAITYARSVALLLTMPNELAGYTLRQLGVLRQPEIMRVDSLMHRAVMEDPFLYRGLADAVLIEYGRRTQRRDEWALRQEQTDDEVAAEMLRYFASSDPLLAGVIAYSRGDYRLALTYYGQALNQNSAPERVHFERALAYHAMGRPDSVSAALTAAIRALAAAPMAPRPRHESVEQWEYALGYLYERQGNLEAARQAYQRSLDADPRYPAAQLRLAVLAVRGGDTATALSRLEFLVGERDEYAPHVLLGGILGELRRPEAGARHLRRAAEIEPWASAPWLLLGRQMETARDTAGAVAAYERFQQLSARSDPNRETVAGRLAALRRAGP